MINKKEILTKIKKITGFEQNLSGLSARKFDELLSQPIGFYSGLPLPEIVTAIAGLGGSALLAIKSIKQVPPGHFGVRITRNKVDDREVLEPGWHVTDPTRIFQKIAVADTQPASARYPGVGRGLLGDGTEITGDVTVTLEILNPRDAVERIEVAPRISLRPDIRTGQYSPGVSDFLTNIVGPEADYATTEAATSLPDVNALTSRTQIVQLRQNIGSRIQERLDEVLLGDDPKAMEAIKKARDGGLPRREVRRGVLVSNVVIEKFQPSEEVIEAFQELVGAPMRTQAEVTLQTNLGEGYSVYSTRRAAIESAERGATVVTNTGLDPAGAGLLARANQTEGKGTKQRLKETRKRLRGRGKK